LSTDSKWAALSSRSMSNRGRKWMDVVGVPVCGMYACLVTCVYAMDGFIEWMESPHVSCLVLCLCGGRTALRH